MRRSPALHIAGTTAWASVRYPDQHEAFLKRCHAAGQTRPTPLLAAIRRRRLQLPASGPLWRACIPLQVAILLSEPGAIHRRRIRADEQRPRCSRARGGAARQGDAVVFAVHHRPVPGSPDFIASTLRHGVSRIRSGKRHTAGVIFHDAK